MRIAATLAKILAPAPKKASSVRAAMRSVHGLTAETVIGALEDSEDYQAFEDEDIGSCRKTRELSNHHWRL